MANSGTAPIEDYALVGGLCSAALISRAGSVDWLCVPRFDSDAIFASLVGDHMNGQWRLNPVGTCTADRAYDPGSMVLRTTWHVESGTADVIDFMAPHEQDPTLIRIVAGITGTVEMETMLRLRFGYGLVVPWVHRMDDWIHAIAGPDSVFVRTPVRLEGRNLSHRATFTVSAGERVPFVLIWRPSHQIEPPDVNPEQALERTMAFWADWSRKCTYEGPYRDTVMRSLITIKALTYSPTGGIVAAPTTSLPEQLGGVRNWDYRYCWLRDATMVLEALLRTGYTDEADAWLRWLARAIAGTAEDVQIMYGVAGERRLPEWEAPWLRGYRGSRPVRIGNAAVNQLQLDTYGEVIDALMLGREAGLHFDKHIAGLCRGLLRFLEEHWSEEDEGIWEVRGPRRHFVHSKVMAWVAFDRAVRLAGRGLPDTPAETVEAWRRIRDEIHAQVCDRGYDVGRRTFTQYYGSNELDAATLLIPEVGFLPPDDERVRSTVRHVQRALSHDGLVQRYTPSRVDGLPGTEGTFLACSFWLVSALVLTGDRAAATKLFEELLAACNDVGLLSEEFDPTNRRQLGNMPQAFSHVALINAALDLAGHQADTTRRRS